MTIRCCVLDQVLPNKVIFTLGAPSNGTCSVCANFAGTYVLDGNFLGQCNQYFLQTGPPGACWGIIITLVITASDEGKLHFRLEFMKFDSSKRYVYTADTDDFSCVTLTCENTGAAADCTFPSTATVEPGELWTPADLKDSTCVPNSEMCIVPEEMGHPSLSTRL